MSWTYKKERKKRNKYLVLHKREADGAIGRTKRWDEEKIAEVNTDFDNKRKKEKSIPRVTYR